MSLIKFATRVKIADLVRMSLVSCSLASCVLFAVAPARAQEPNLWDKALGSVGLGAKPDPAGQQPQAAPQQAVQTPQVRQSSQAPQAPQAPQAAQAPPEPGMWEKVTNTVGLGKKPEASTIDYSERPKLNVPQQRELPRPSPMPERQVTNRASQEEALTRPPADYSEKIKGADGKVEGLREGDVAKEKKFLNFF